MKACLLMLSVVSLAFAGISAALGVQATNVRSEYSWNSDQADFEQFERERADAHFLVKCVSLPYYLACCVVLALSLAWLSRRVVPIIGIVVSAVMLLWTLAIGPGASFDEVFPAWIAAAIVLAVLQLVLGLARPRAVTAARQRRVSAQVDERAMAKV